MREALIWYIAVQATALAVWPVVAAALSPLEDRGWAAAKAVGILALAWLVWVVCMLSPVPYTRATLVLGLLLIACAAWVWAWRYGSLTLVLGWMRRQRPLLLVWEVVFLGTFSLFAVLRAHEPAIAAFQKPLDMAFVNGFMSAQRLPTQDTWLAGYGVPYYYFGYFVAACLGKLTGLSAGVGYNLAAATVPALAGVGLASLAWNLARGAHVSAAWSAAGAALAT